MGKLKIYLHLLKRVIGKVESPYVGDAVYHLTTLNLSAKSLRKWN